MHVRELGRSLDRVLSSQRLAGALARRGFSPVRRLASFFGGGGAEWCEGW